MCVCVCRLCAVEIRLPLIHSRSSQRPCFDASSVPHQLEELAFPFLPHQLEE
jgi:hypothetical protein